MKQLLKKGTQNVKRFFAHGFLLLIALWIQTATAQDGPVIREIRIRGNDWVETSLIASQSGLFEGQNLAGGEAARAIRNLYKLGLFSDIKIFMERVPGGVAVIIDLKAVPRLGSVVFKGNSAMKDKTLKRELGLIENQLIQSWEKKRAVNKLIALYRKKGYLLAAVDVAETKVDGDGRLPLVFEIDEGAKVNLKKIRFHGNAALTGKQLRKQMKETKQDGWWFGGGKFSEETYPEDKEKVLAFYRQNGYRDAAIASDSLSYGPNKRDMFLDITIEEGPIYRFGAVTWAGNEKINDAGFVHFIVVDSATVYNEERVQKSREQLHNAYMDIGHIGAQIFPQQKPAGDRVIDVHFDVVENDPWKIRKILIEGNTKTKDRVIRRELRVRPGDTFSRALLERSVREVMVLNFFANVLPEPKAVEETSEIDLVFTIEEKSTGTASIGAGYSERDRLIGTIGLQIPNFRGNGQQLDFQWEFGSRRETFSIGFTEPWLLNTPTLVSASLSRRTLRLTNYGAANFDQRDEGGAFRLGRRLRWPDYSRISGGYSLRRVSFLNFADSTDAANPYYADNITSSISANLTRDSRDLPIFPTSGSVISYSPALAGGFLGGSRDFHKHDFVTSFYFPLFWRLALNVKSQLGFAASYGPEPVPFQELYTPGGVDIFDGTLLRGYPDRSIGPVDNRGTPLGGVAQLLFNAEVSIPIVPQQFYGLIFADAGNAWGNLDRISLTDLRRSVGFGIRIVAPVVGIMGFDFAWGIDRRHVDGQKVQMMTHFQFGPQFH